MTRPTLRVAVAGLAGIGKVHVRLLEESAEAAVAAVCDIAPAAFGAVTTEAPRFTDYERMLDEVRPDAVILATPPASHRAMTLASAARGVHALVEKPMAESVASARAMIDACRSVGVVLMLGHKKRFVPALARLKALLDGELGPAQVAIYRYVHPGRSEKAWFWAEEDGGGPLRENAVHAADTLRWLCGEVVRIQGEGDFFTFADRAPQPNCAVMTLRFESGAIASLTAGMVGVHALRGEDLYITTERGVAEVSGPFDNPGTLRWALRGEPEPRLESLNGDPFRLEQEHFFYCIRSGAAPLTSGEEGLKSLELCERWKKAVVW